MTTIPNDKEVLFYELLKKFIKAQRLDRELYEETFANSPQDLDTDED